MTSTASRTTLRATALACATLLLAACGSAAGAGSSASATTSAARPTGGAGGGQGQFPGASGLVAAVQGRTLQVQGASSQTAVTWAAGTTFTRVVPTTAAAVRVGACVQVRSGQQPGASAPATQLVAASVMVSTPVKGTCSVAAAFGGRGAGPGQGGPRPSGTRTGVPGRGFGGAFGGVFGSVASVGAGSFVVTATVPQRGGTDTTTATPGTAPRTVTVTTTAATTYTTTVPATAAAAKVGTCVTARGRADSTGAIAATAITVRPAVGGQCTGFGRPGSGVGRG
ncbi:hypothetical protein RKE38_13700 [Phycicoccus sp. M110.8]|uniref:hypothetical protein n=1 Tax=Phycicoccus sp. M110.8 TaxID=3075433 RepID=UPI0028FDBCF5|nr:hypothetical protein [Phycicoccus sp. M110.8]MDU0314748.1 hypothetical protein [Phycicoccus sp. M110.8]